MNFDFRRINATDIDSVWSLIEILKVEKVDMTLTDLVSKTEIMNFVDNPAQLTYVALTKDEPQQVICLVKGWRDLKLEKAHSAFISAATHPDYRGCGLAAKLTNYALGQMKNEGITIARIYIYSNNEASLNAIRKLNFVQSGAVLRHHLDIASGEFVDDLIFHKILN